jgi:hypothetical protein
MVSRPAIAVAAVLASACVTLAGCGTSRHSLGDRVRVTGAGTAQIAWTATGAPTCTPGTRYGTGVILPICQHFTRVEPATSERLPWTASVPMTLSVPAGPVAQVRVTAVSSTESGRISCEIDIPGQKPVTQAALHAVVCLAD